LSSPPVATSKLKAALDHFPDDRPFLLRLAMADEAFRSVCEDYKLACRRLAALRSAEMHADPAELSDYVTLVAELEAEMTGLLETARRVGVP
jgi:hypothetical protein